MTFEELFKIVKKHKLMKQDISLCAGSHHDLIRLDVSWTDEFTHPSLDPQLVFSPLNTDGECDPNLLRIIDPLQIEYIAMNNPKGY